MQGQSTSKGSFTHCTARFKGKRDAAIVDGFIETSNVYRGIERIDERGSVKNIQELLTKARAVELSRVEKEGKVETVEKKSCNFCRHVGYTMSECRKKET